VVQEQQKADGHKLAAGKHARDATRLREEIGRETIFVDTADAAMYLREELKQCPADLATN